MRRDASWLSACAWHRYRDPMTQKPMLDADFEALVARLRAGERIPHVDHLGQYPITTAHRSELTAKGDAFAWTTYFVEHLDDHRWRHLTEEQSLDEAALRALLER